jgi:mono/diheme cytochrome c family protein
VALLVLLAGAGWLTYAAVREDRGDVGYRNAVWVAHHEAKLAEFKAEHEGIPLDGMKAKLRRDPQALAFNVLVGECFKCHNYQSPEGAGYEVPEPTAPNLYGFGTKRWAAGLLDPQQIIDKHYFGNTELKSGEMVAFLKNPETGGKLTAEDRDQLADALATEATGKADADAAKRMQLFGNKGCLECHNYGEEGGGLAPQLKGWGSTDWLTRMIANPNDPSFYGHLGKNQTMPAFGMVEGNEQAKNLDPAVIREIARWLRGEWEADPSSH